jgi:glucose uptake protein
VLSLILGSLAYSYWKAQQHETLARAGKTKSTRRPSSLKALLLALAGGIGLGTFAPLLLRAQDPDDGVGPYSMLVLFSLGVFASTFVFNLFFMNLPVEGDPLEIADYIKTPIKNHLIGAIGGAVWGLGALATFVVHTPKGDIHPTGAWHLMLAQAAPIVTALWGALLWKEFKGSDLRVKAFAGLMLLFFLGGLTFFSYAAVSAK